MKTSIFILFFLILFTHALGQKTIKKQWSDERNEETKVLKENIGGPINSKNNEFAPIISADGRVLYFVKNNDQQIIEKWGEENQEIYYSVLKDDSTWSDPIDMGQPLNNNDGNFVVAITPDRNKLFLGNRYTETGETNGGGLSVSSLNANGTWSIPVDVNIEEFENKNNYVSYALSPDNKVLVTAIENKKSMGNLDLFVCFSKGENIWSKPKHMGRVVNSRDLEFSPFIGADAQTLYFSSKGHKGHGSADIFMSKRLDDSWTKWSEPVNLGPEINSPQFDAYFTIPASGDVAYLSSSNNSMGGVDIFKVELLEEVRPDPVALISGNVINAKTGEAISAQISYKILKTNEEVGKATSSQSDGKYQISLKGGEKYSFMAEKPGFYAVSDFIDLTNLNEYREIERALKLAPIEKGEVIRLNNLFFKYDTAELIEDSFGELKNLHSTLEKNPSLKIQISGHTDDKGSDAYNLSLSNRRAKAVVDYLIEKGVSSYRLSSKGYGESEPIATNETEEGRQQNRRVEFLILEK